MTTETPNTAAPAENTGSGGGNSSAAYSMRQEMAKELEKLKAEKVANRKKTDDVEIKQDEKFADIKSNTFHKIMYSDASPEQKREAVEKALTFDKEKSKEENMKLLKEFELFKEYMQSVRKIMAQQIIKMTDTDAMSELKDVYEQMNSSMLEFEDSMKPLMTIIDAVYQLRMKGGDVAFNIFKEIAADREHEEAQQRVLEEKAKGISNLEDQIATAQRSINESMTQNKKHFFGLFTGGLTEAAQHNIAQQEAAIKAAREQIAAIGTEVQAIKDMPPRESQFKELAEEKAKLRELLDISSPEHKERQKRLVDAAQNFVITTEQRVGSVLNHYGAMGDQIIKLGDNNTRLQTVYAVMTDAAGNAAAKNTEIFKEFATVPENETTTAKIKRENKQLDVQDYIDSMNSSTLEANETLADLTTQGLRIKNLKDTNREQVTKTRKLHSSGVAGVADRLSTVLQTVSNAALNESAELAGNTVIRMNSSTDLMAQKESLGVAKRIGEEGKKLEAAIDQLISYRDTANQTAELARENYEYVKGNLAIMRKVRDATAESIKNAKAVGAEVELLAGQATDEDVSKMENKAGGAPAEKKATSTGTQTPKGNANDDPFAGLNM